MRREFLFYGVRLSISAEAAPALGPALEWLAEDFSFFAASSVPEDARASINLTLHESKPEDRPDAGRRRPLFRTSMCEVYGLSNPRICDYGHGSWVVSRTRRGDLREFEVHSPAPEAAYEWAYLAILSAVGEELDLLGYHRVHALGFSDGSHAGLFLLDSGSGKSTCAALLLRDSETMLFSDEMPLLRRGVIHPFPIRIGLRPEAARAFRLEIEGLRFFHRKIYPKKALLPIPGTRVAPPARLGFIGLQGGGASFLLRTVVGLGLPQMSEFMLRGENLGRIAWIALSRLREGAFALLRARRIELSSQESPASLKDAAIALLKGR